ncbi:hypothetical protein FKR81_14785 [Lentzea tibetensis]|uniref:Uncharacterized protein n=1 Tax=Lentzea tibetensis TaxID=2591470 RepID=A0A563EUV1_9PSEU|nr:hypothetical protein [Lentzea tibetensis]TWP51475.1 hypothetical protein FKR81_14785 [Lentzea tibetensis]
MSTYFSALSVAMAHQLSQPPPSSPASVRCGWWREHHDLLIGVADAVDVGRQEADRARQLAGHALGEVRSLLCEAVS